MRDCVKNDRNLLVFSVGITPVTAINDAGIDVSHQIALVPKAERSEAICFELHRGTGYAEVTRTQVDRLERCRPGDGVVPGPWYPPSKPTTM
jgi:hypothetical protein